MKPYSESSWRNHAAPIIAKVIADNPGLDEKALRKLIGEKYPFGQRKNHPYKIWLSEVARQLAGGKCPVFVDQAGKKLAFGDRSDPFGERQRA